MLNNSFCINSGIGLGRPKPNVDSTCNKTGTEVSYVD